MKNHYLAVPVLAALGLGIAGKTWACSCVPIEDWSDHARASQVIFTGKAVQRTDSPPRTDSSGASVFASDDPTAYDFEVADAIKGVRGGTLRLWTPRDGASCGERFLLDTTYLVFGYVAANDSLLRTGLCRGNMRLGTPWADSVLAVTKAATNTLAVRKPSTRGKLRGADRGSWAWPSLPKAGPGLETRARRLDGRRNLHRPSLH